MESRYPQPCRPDHTSLVQWHPQAKPNFLTLPAHIREEIYIHAGLVRFCPVDVAFEPNRQPCIGRDRKIIGLKTDKQTQELCNIRCPYRLKLFARNSSPPSMGIQYGARCICLRFPIQLLRTCRQLYEETFPILYGRNKFFFTRDALLVFNARQCERLTSLHVCLTSCSCITGHECQRTPWFQEGLRCEDCHASCRRGSSLPFSLDVPEDYAVLMSWWNLCFKLQQGQDPRGPKLKLAFVCDCRGWQTALEVVAPLNYLSSSLSSCSVRLGQSPDENPRRLAEHMALKLVLGAKEPTFPLLQLPEELQELVLNFTDLTSPLYLSWNKSDKRGLRGYSKTRLRQFQDNGLRCCLKCSETAIVCLCPTRHAAYTSNNCTCWKFPSDIFCVNRKFNYLAEKIFLSKNKFILHDDNLADSRVHYVWRDPAKSYLEPHMSFLHRFPERTVKYLRWIRLTSSSFISSEAVNTTSSRHQKWKELTDLIKTKLSTALLTIELDFYWLSPSDLESVRERDEKWISYQNITKLFQLPYRIGQDAVGRSTYHDFFIRLASPQPTSYSNDLIRWERERELEKLIMGSEYDSAKRGKYSKRARGFWQEMVYYQDIVYGPDGEALNPPGPSHPKEAERYDPDESKGPRKFELR